MDLSVFAESTVQEKLFGLFILALFVQLCYYLAYFSRLALFKKTSTEPFSPPVSIIICARNEEDNLAAFLPDVLEQDYPTFEVVVVNDCSFDNTADVLKELTNKYPHLKIVTINETKNHEHGKKIAVMMGVKGASNEYLLFTDADCKPNSKEWLRNMAGNFSNKETEIVLGYGGYEKQKGFLNKMIRFDTFFIALQYLSFALAGKTYMGVGRNLAYKKSLFFKMKGFASHYHIDSGDDDLFVNEAATKHNSKIEISIESHTISRVKKTFMGWFAQKRRHIVTFKHYNAKTKWRLRFIGGSQYLFFLLFITLLAIRFEPILVASLFFLRQLVQLIIFIKPMKLLNEKDLIYIFPVVEFILLFVYPAFAISNFILKKVNWR
jgi:glycosyltransferase involved in cell wall biosynthesis